MVLRRAAAAAVLTLSAAAAQSQPVVLVNEGFNNVATLPGSGWVLTNASTPVGSTGWFQGLPDIFPAQAGPVNSYAAANFNSAAAGGTIANWLISPVFSTEPEGTVTFWLRAANEAGFSDHVAWGFSAGSASIADFGLGPPQTVDSEWTQFTVHYTAHGVGATGRFAIAYQGAADLSNYVGVDTFAVTAAIPEPETWALLMFGAASVGLVARRRKPPQ